VAVQVESERTFDCEKLRDRFADKGCSCIACHSTEALLELCESGDYELILILGSIYLIGSIRALMLNM
jgi:folylpolyglutamate synthase/dihydropteroate synthase